MVGPCGDENPAARSLPEPESVRVLTSTTSRRLGVLSIAVGPGPAAVVRDV